MLAALKQFFSMPGPVEDGFPDADWVLENQLTGHTYDASKLERSKYQLMFVCDQMQQGMRMYDTMLKGFSKPLYTAFTYAENFTMWKKKLGQGTFPIPLRIPHTRVPRARIKGQLHKVLSSRYSELDLFKLNGVEFRRKRVPVLVPYQHEGIDNVGICEAWMYMGRYTYWQDHLDAGFNFTTCRRFSPKNMILSGSYYAFTPLEYDD